MKGFLADEHIPLNTIQGLRSAGHYVLSIRENHQSISDHLILDLAERENLVVITNDRDFGDLILNERKAFTAGLIFCRLTNVSPTKICELILYHIAKFGVEYSGQFTVISNDRFRQRAL